ncbi:hypothetical protein H8356DRAFT_1301756 [Neocallimastix lanati (nom. inval.)]|nr:hypothetical protein H8356DRAFT_1301756 [Neocallimastix sp. JGI-2020a]
MDCDDNSIALTINDIPMNFFNDQLMDIDDNMIIIPSFIENIINIIKEKIDSHQEIMSIDYPYSLDDDVLRDMAYMIFEEIDVLSKKLISLLNMLIDSDLDYDLLYSKIIQPILDIKNSIIDISLNENSSLCSDINAMEIDYKDTVFD